MSTKLERLIESIKSDSNGGFGVRFLEGNKVEVTKYDDVVEVVELEEGDNLEECLKSLEEEYK